MQKVVLVLLAVLSVVLAQRPRPCVSPFQWEGRVLEHDGKEAFGLRGRLSYDAVYQRERVVEEVILGTDKEFFDTLYLHRLQTEYRYSFKTRNCTTRPITRRWRDFGVPENATNYGESYLGSSAVFGGHLLTSIWGLNFTDAQGDLVNYFGVWTLEGCLPVTISYSSQRFGTLHSTFLDLTPGIEDPNRFIPRPECFSK